MLRYIQYARASAALLVVFFHAAGTLSLSKYFGASAKILEKYFWFGGRAGVAFFFVLSGFIIHHIHSKDIGHPNRIPKYLKKRLARIYPIYWVIFISVCLLAQLSPSLKATIPTDWVLLIKSLLLLPQDKMVVGGTGAPVLDVAWSLQYEMLFYAVFAFSIISKRTFAIIITAWILLITLSIPVGDGSFPLSFFSSHLIFLFILGILSSIFNNSRYHLPSPRAVASIAILLFILTGLFANNLRGQLIGGWLDWTYGIFGALAISALVQMERTAPNSSSLDGHTSRILSMIGDASYSMYLIHFPLISILCKILAGILVKNQIAAIFSFVVIIVVSIIASLAFHFLIERPIQQRLSPKRHPTQTGSSVKIPAR